MQYDLTKDEKFMKENGVKKAIMCVKRRRTAGAPSARIQGAEHQLTQETDMSKRTIETFAKIAAKQAEADAASNVLGCTCSNKECGLTWIVCLFPQTMARITKLTSMHTKCPNCGTANPMLAKAAAIRPLLGEKE